MRVHPAVVALALLLALALPVETRAAAGSVSVVAMVNPRTSVAVEDGTLCVRTNQPVTIAVTHTDGRVRTVTLARGSVRIPQVLACSVNP